MRDVTIVGAGIGGLTAALALSRAGCRVTIVERAPRLEPLGAGIVMAANAARILLKLGVDVAAYGEPLRRMLVNTAAGQPIQLMDFDKFLSGQGQVLSFHRAELHAALLAALPTDVTLRLGCAYPDGCAPPDGLLIGADGIYSSVRERLLGTVPLSYSGYTCWRMAVPNPGVRDSFEAWDGQARIGVVTLTGNRIYVFFVLTAPPGTPRQTSIEAVREHFQHFADPVPAILDAARGCVLLHHDIEELENLVWGKGRVVLIGDAAHAMTPNLGQGAAMAIEDAAVLPRVVDAADPAAALREIRHGRVSKVHRDSRRLGQVAHWKAPAAIWLRNALFRSVPDSLSERQYLQLIGPGLELAERV